MPQTALIQLQLFASTNSCRVLRKKNHVMSRWRLGKGLWNNVCINHFENIWDWTLVLAHCWVSDFSFLCFISCFALVFLYSQCLSSVSLFTWSSYLPPSFSSSALFTLCLVSTSLSLCFLQSIWFVTPCTPRVFISQGFLCHNHHHFTIIFLQGPHLHANCTITEAFLQGRFQTFSTEWSRSENYQQQVRYCLFLKIPQNCTSNDMNHCFTLNKMLWHK